MSLREMVADLAAAVVAVDATRPVAVSARTGASYQPGIGPHSETRTVELLAERLAVTDKRAYGSFALGVPYPASKRMACDYCLGTSAGWTWALEFKMLRLMGDNGKPNDNMLMHVLSPYPAHRSALTDCSKLAINKMAGRQAVIIYGYDYRDWAMDPAIDAFETLASRVVELGRREAAEFDGLVHPVHQRGRVFAWEIGNALT